MGGWLRKAPRFCDVEERGLCLQKCGRVEFFAPHPRDQLATMPLISGLSEALNGKGVETETHSVEDMKSGVLSISLKLRRLGLSRKELEEADALFLLKDAVIRLELVSGLLGRNPGCAVVEVQALDKDYCGKEQFAEASLFYRIPGTRVLHLRDYAGGFLADIRKGLGVLEAPHGRLGRATGAFGLSSESLRMELPALLDSIHEGRSRAAMVCIPADPFNVEPWTGEETRFEMVFGEGMTRKHTLGPADMAALASALS